MKYLGSVIGNEESKLLKLSKKAVDSLESAARKIRSVELIEDKEFRGVDHSNLNQVEYELMMDESSSPERIADESANPKAKGIQTLFKQLQNLF